MWSHIVPSDNVPMLRALGRDPLFQKKTRANALYGLVDLMDEARAAPAHLEDPPPILFLTGAQDQLIPAAPTKAVIAELGSRADGAPLSEWLSHAAARPGCENRLAGHCRLDREGTGNETGVLTVISPTTNRRVP